MRMEENRALAPLTTMGIGGAARWFAEATSEPELVEAFRWAGERGLKLDSGVFVLGGGSNLLVADGGFDGLVVRVGLKGIEADGGAGVYRVAAGEEWDGFVSRTVADGCAGVECLAGIPGTVGGTPVQNVGAYGQEVAETIERVRVMDRGTLEFFELNAAECGFAYRQSIFNTTARGRYVVTRVDYRLRPGGEANLRYADLQKAFGVGTKPGLASVAAAVREIRRGKGMLLVDGDADCRSAGSFFRNPVIGAKAFQALTERLGAKPPHYEAGSGRVKLPAAWLIEQAGFRKGFAMGQVGISSRHTLALVNRGGGTAAEMMALREQIVDAVETRFGMRLEMEPVLLGF